jgi:hypothetical protein
MKPVTGMTGSKLHCRRDLDRVLEGVAVVALHQWSLEAWRVVTPHVGEELFEIDPCSEIP